MAALMWMLSRLLLFNATRLDDCRPVLDLTFDERLRRPRASAARAASRSCRS